MSAAPRLRIERVSAADVRPLRSAVLRPGMAPEKLVYEGDESAEALHVAARDDAGGIHGIASLCREAAPSRSGTPAWRLRGMATTPAVRGSGVGRRLLQACFRHIRADGGGLLWCNARVVALEFYERMGLAREGAEFDIPGIGPHYVMTRWLPRLRPARAEEAGALTDLALASKATWGYPADFLRRVAPDLEVTAADIRAGARHFVVADIQGERVGFQALEPQVDGEVRLDAVFVAPAWIRRGIGRDLFEHAAGVALKLGASRLVAVADPNAAGFYRRMGARQEGEIASPAGEGRRLPRFVLDLA